MITVLCSAVLLAASSSADAQKSVKKSPNPNAAIVNELHKAVAVLKQADHDYMGHRVKAIHHIHTAVKALGPAGKHGKIAPGTGKLEQSVSDGLLQQAIQQLTTIQTTLANTPGFGNRPMAVMAIQGAIAELQTALKIR